MNYFSRLGKRITTKVERTMNYIKDILNLNPKDFSWKMRWRMRRDRNPLFVTVQDKYKVKEYAQKRGVRTAELLYVTDKPETIPFDSLPENYFVKANHGCDWNILCKAGKLYLYKDGSVFIGHDTLTPHTITRQECINKCRSWLRSIYSRNEWAYKRIPPRIIVEEVLIQHDGGELMDYRFYVFRGIVKAISVGSPSYRLHHETVFFSPDWQEFKMKVYGEGIPDQLPQKPPNLAEMLSIAEKLGAELDFARIDLFYTTRGVTLGEMSIYPLGGRLNTPAGDPEFDQWLGDQWMLPNENH